MKLKREIKESAPPPRHKCSMRFTLVRINTTAYSEPIELSHEEIVMRAGDSLVLNVDGALVLETKKNGVTTLVGFQYRGKLYPVKP